jgi:hypothetical protein
VPSGEGDFFCWWVSADAAFGDFYLELLDWGRDRVITSGPCDLYGFSQRPVLYRFLARSSIRARLTNRTSADLSPELNLRGVFVPPGSDWP